MSEPFISTIIIVDTPAFHQLTHTVQTALSQKEVDHEIIIVQKNSYPVCTFVENHRMEMTRIYCSINENIFSMMNKGIELAQGEYLHFLFPGEYYNTPLALAAFKEALPESEAHLICSGFIQRTNVSRPKALFYPLNEMGLERAKYHSSLQSYFFKKELFGMVGRFNPDFSLQGNFDLLCRISKDRQVKIHYLKRVLTDYENRKFSPEIALEEAIQRLKIVLKHFGLGRAFFWWVAQNHTQFIKWWFRLVREAVWRSSN